jgi:ABC-2 type transport system permease protein
MSGEGGAPGAGGVSRLRKFGSVVRAGLRANFGLAVLKHRLLVEKKDRWLVPLIGLAALGVVPMFYGLVLLIQNFYLALKPTGQERALLSFGILAGQILILVFGIYYVIAAFYFSRDLEVLVPLPLRPAEVMASKFAVIVINEYLTVAAVVLPVVVTVGVLARARPGYWINATLVYLALPIIPLGIVSVAVVAMMRFVNISRKKDALILVGSLVLISLSFAVQIGIGRSSANGGDINAEALTTFFVSPNSLLNRVGAIFPPGIWATKAVAAGFTGEGLLNLALLLGVSIACLAGMIVVGETLFYRGLVGLGETTGRKRRLTQAEMARRVTSGRRAFAAVFGREWKIMNRTPIFLLNGILVSFLVPAIFVLMATIDPGARGGGADAGHNGAPMVLIRAMLASNPLVVILGAALFMTICGCVNGTASSTFSREGGQFWISQTIPVAPREQAAAKFLHSYLVGSLGVVTASAVAVGFFRLSIVHVAPAFVLSLVAAVLLTAVGMMIDLARPLLDWTNPQKAIKQNLNVLLALLADIGIMTAVFFAAKALIKARLGTVAVLGAVSAGLAVLAAASYAVLLKFADKRYPEIE